MLLIAKNYIYKCKLKGKLPNIFELESKIRSYYFVEKHIAAKNNKLVAHEQYWAPLHKTFTQTTVIHI